MPKLIPAHTQKFITGVNTFMNEKELVALTLQFWHDCKAEKPKYFTKSFSNTILNRAKIKLKIDKAFSIYTGETLLERIFNGILNIDNSGSCFHCSKPTKFCSLPAGYAAHCSKQCSCDSKKTKDKRKSTCLIRYGYDSHLKSPEIKNKIESTFLTNYGVKSCRSVPSVIEKSNNTKISLHGEDYKKAIREKYRLTCLEKYGVENTSQVPSIRDRIAKSGYNRKEHVAFGKTFLVQGAENQALEFLEASAMSDLSDITNLAVHMPTISYFWGNKNRKYFPDFYIPSKNMFIEVKSAYTITRDVERNNLKFAAVTNSGFNFCLLVQVGRTSIFNIIGNSEFLLC